MYGSFRWKIEDAWFRFLWWTYFFPFKPVSAPKWWRKFKENLYEWGVAISLIVLSVVVVAIELVALAAIYRFVFFSNWSWSFVSAFITWIVIYLANDWRVKRREQRERDFMLKHMETS